MHNEQHPSGLDNLHFKTLTEVADLIQSREISSVELTTTILDRIKSLDNTLKSYATVMADHALAAAKKADAEIEAGQYRGPLHGVPIAVKDLCFTKGVRTMGGSAVFADHIPDYDATVVSKLEAAGAILLGKLNLTEGAMGGYHPELDIPKNPWNKDRWAGASSSGSGVATAAGLAYGTLGSDTGGSIRFPSAACGIVGLKPTWGRVSRYGVFALAESLDHVGPMVRSTADAAAMLQAIAGHDPNDPTSLPDPVPDLLGNIDKDIKGVRIGLDKDYITRNSDPKLAKAVISGTKELQAFGVKIVPITFPDVDQYVPAWISLCSAEAVLAHSQTYPSRREEYGPWFRDWLDIGANVTGADYARANILRATCNGLFHQVFQEIDILACPTMNRPPHPVTPEALYGPIGDRDPNMGRFTQPFDYSGRPTLSVPCGLNQKDLPLSLQFVGNPLDEQLLCQVGHAYEKATEWHTLRPDI